MCHLAWAYPCWSKVSTLVLEIVREMGRNIRKTLYKCIKAHIYKEKCNKLRNAARAPHLFSKIIVDKGFCFKCWCRWIAYNC